MRLTEKVKEPLQHYATKNIQFDLPKIVDKLGQLEDIEEELGIDLITLFKAFKNGIWVKIWKSNTNTTETYHAHIILNYPLLMVSNTVAVAVKDYGKTWALTKEELL